MTGRLDGQVALVSGAGKNIGRAIAHRLAADGAAVIVNGRRDQAVVETVAAEIKGAGGKAIAALGDVSIQVDCEAVVARGIEAFGGLDIVVSNAGLRRQTPFIDMDFAEWREILSVALDGAFLPNQGCRSASD